MTKRSDVAGYGAIEYTRSEKVTLPSKQERSSTLLSAASAAVLSVGLASAANAQAVPAECAPNPALTGDTVLCVAPAPIEIDGIATNVDDLTVIVGDAAVPTTVNETAGDGVNMTGGGPQTLNIVNTGSSVTGSDSGAEVRVTSGASDLTVVSEGSVSGAMNGIYARHSGAGAVSVTSADVTGTVQNGVFAQSGGGGVSVDSSTGTVMGGTLGIFAQATGAGAVSVTSAIVTGTNGTGILAQSAGGGITVNSSAGAVMGGFSGIFAQDTGVVTLSITSADVTGLTGDGIFANQGNGPGTAAIVIDSSAGAVIGGRDGIEARGNGNISITTADVTGNGSNDRGIFGYINAVGNGDLMINSTAGTVMGGFDGVAAQNLGTGGISVTTADVSSTNLRAGIIVSNAAISTGDIMVDTTAGSITGVSNGIRALNSGTGNMTISSANVTGTGSDGIFAYSSAISGDLSVSSIGIVMGATEGIQTRQDGGGDVTINANIVTGANAAIDSDATSGDTTITLASTAVVTGTTGAGIDAQSTGGAITLQGMSGDVVGATDGFYSRSMGGAITVNNIDSITGNAGDGIDAVSNGGDITITSVDTILGTGGNGTSADSDGGDISIQGSGTVGGITGTGSMLDGIYADARSGVGGNINIGGTTTNGDITGGRNGIFALTDGAGNITIDSTGGTISGNSGGIDARNFGEGAISITSADVSTTGFDGIAAISYSATNTGGVSVNSTAGTVAGSSRFGIFARNNGAGDTTITTADVNSTNSNAIYANIGSTATGDVTIDSSAGTVTGGNTGINIINSGSGVLSITTADVTGTARGGIYAESRGGGTTIDTSAGSVMGSYQGINAKDRSNGAVSITTADVTGGATSNGIFGRSYVGGGVTIDSSAGSVTGGRNGIYASDLAAGDVSVITADVTGTTNIGIEANSRSGVLTIDSSAGTVMGATRGIFARGLSAGDVFVTTADVTGTSSDGLYVSAGGGGNISIDTTAGTVIGGTNGIRAYSYSSGAFSITTNDVTGATGIDSDAGSGATTITLGSRAVVTGTLGVGIDARASGGAITVQGSSGDVVGATDGINSRSGGGAITVQNLDSVTGNAGDGIDVGSSGGDITITGIDTILGTGGNGILANSTGGDISIQGNGLVGGIEGTGGAGILADARSSGGSINIGDASVNGDISGSSEGIVASTDSAGSITIDSSTGIVTGGGTGIRAVNYGNGAIDITSADVTGTNSNGIFASLVSGASDVTIDTTAGTVTGGYAGIFNANFGTGTLSVTTADVTGMGGHGIEINSQNTILDTTAGTVMGNYSGIRASSFGNGGLSVTTADVTGTTRMGIYAHLTGSASTSDLTVDSSAGTVTGSTYGINAVNYGMGATTVTANIVSGGIGDGIIADTSGTDITVNTLGAVSGGRHGINTRNSGLGALRITATDATGTTGNGINALNQAVPAGGSYMYGPYGPPCAAGGVYNGTDLTITTTGTVQGGENGIRALNYGSGATTITADKVTATSGFGIRTTNRDRNGNSFGTDMTIISNGDVTGLQGGIRALNGGSGSLTVSSNSVEGTGMFAVGLFAYQGPNGINSAINVTGTVAGGSNATAIGAYSNGSGTLEITANDVTGYYGIRAFNNKGTDVSITTTGSVNATRQGIYSINYGSGALNINAVDLATTGGNYSGIRARNEGTDLAINTTGSVVGGSVGIEAHNSGTGSLSITTNDVTARNGTGILAAAGSKSQSDLSIIANGNILSEGEGIDATSFGFGGIRIASANITSASGIGIEAFNSRSGDLTIDTSAGTIVGTQGIFARNFGSGATSITTADVTGMSGFGVSAEALSFAKDMTVDTSAGSVIAQSRGIDARNIGSGVLTINTAAVTGMDDHAIAAVGFGADIAIATTGDIIGGADGINALNRGIGALTITSTNVTGNDGDGIHAANGMAPMPGPTYNDFGITTMGPDLPGTAGTDLTIDSSGTVNGSSDGIGAFNNGTGDTRITAAGNVTGIQGTGIRATNLEMAGAITITATGDIFGGVDGINTSNAGTGITTISVSDVTGTNGNGISASDSATSSGIVIDSSAGTVIGGINGIVVTSTGAIQITIAGVTGMRSSGIVAQGLGSNITIESSGSVSGGNYGVYAIGDGPGAISITATNVTGKVRNGITAVGGAMTRGISIYSSTGSVMGGINGINVNHAGTDGVVINAANVTGGTTGIFVSHSGTGSTMVMAAPTATAVATTSPVAAGMTAVESSQPEAVAVAQASNSTASVSDTSVEAQAIAAPQNARGMILDNMAFTGNRLDPAQLSNEAQGSDELIAEETAFAGGASPAVSGDQTSGDNAVSVGETVVEKVAVVTGDSPSNVGGNDNAVSLADNTDAGPAAVTSNAVTSNATSDGVGISIMTSGDVTGGTNGIVANNTGDGSVLINTMGDVTGTTGTGIMAIGGANGDLVSITTGGMVTGGITGIWADAGSGDLLLNIGGDVTGGDNGIVTITEGGTTLTVAAGQTITGGTVGIGTMATGGSATSNDILNILGTVNGAIMTFEGDDIVTLADGSMVNGAIMLGAGADTLNFNGGVMGAIRGGNDEDTLNFNSGAGLFTDSGDAADGIAEFEIYNFNVGGFALGGTHQGLTATNFNVGDHMLLGTLGSTNVNIVTGATLQVSDGAIINGSLNNMGGLGVNANGLGTLNINGNLTQSADGILTLDVLDGTNLDQIIVTGDVTLDGALVINQGEFVMETTTLIDGGTGLFGNFSSVSGLSTGGLLISQTVLLDSLNNDVNLSVAFTTPANIIGLTSNQINVANNLVDQLRSGNLMGDLEDIGLAISSIGDANTLGNALDELHPEILNGGIEVFRNSQMLFLRTLLNSSAPEFGTGSFETASLAPVAMPKSSDGPNIWGSIQYTNYEQNGGLINLNFDTDGFEVATGISNIEAGPFMFGVAVGYAELDTIENGIAGDRIQTDLFRLGASATVDLNQSDKGLQAHLDTAVAAAFGSNEATMNIVIPAIGLTAQQNGEADIDSFSIFSRLTIDGIGDKAWAIKPHLLVGYNKTSQDALALGAGTTALSTQSGDFDRFTFGYGLTLEQNLNHNTAIKVGVSGVHHSDDTRSLLASRFVGTGTGAQLFNTTGKSIRDQYLFETSLDQNLGGGWTASLDGYAEFGDLEGFGGLLKIGKRF